MSSIGVDGFMEGRERSGGGRDVNRTREGTGGFSQGGKQPTPGASDFMRCLERLGEARCLLGSAVSPQFYSSTKSPSDMRPPAVQIAAREGPGLQLQEFCGVGSTGARPSRLDFKGV